MPIFNVLFKKQEKPITVDDILLIAGPLDEAIIAAIRHTGASAAEVLQAFDWLEEDRYTKVIFIRKMDERVRRVYDILDYARNSYDRKDQGH